MDYGQIIEGAQEKLKQLMAKREALDREILAVTKIIEGAQLGAQSPSEYNPEDRHFSPTPDEEPPTKFADKVRLILQKSGTPLYPTEIRERLESLGVEASTPKHLLIHVHKVLERLFENNEVTQVTRNEKTAYKMLSPMEQVMREYIDPLAGLATPSFIHKESTPKLSAEQLAGVNRKLKK
jgi:hypothetical protein